jgi:hypothetical protein
VYPALVTATRALEIRMNASTSTRIAAAVTAAYLRELTQDAAAPKPAARRVDGAGRRTTAARRVAASHGRHRASTRSSRAFARA